MRWETPEFVMLRMDAEIGAYQEDDPSREPLFVEAQDTARAEAE